jgi:hypothetical protein
MKFLCKKGRIQKNYQQFPSNHWCKMEVIMNTNQERIEKRQNILKVMEESFVMIPAKLMRDVAEGRITTGAYFLYCYLLFRQGEKANYWGSVKDICWGTGFSPAQISRLLKQLKLCGHIERSKRMGETWLTYCVTRVKGRRIYFPDRSAADTFKDSRLAGESKKKPTEMVQDDGQTSSSSQESHSAKKATGDVKEENPLRRCLEIEVTKAKAQSLVCSRTMATT